MCLNTLPGTGILYHIHQGCVLQKKTKTKTGVNSANVARERQPQKRLQLEQPKPDTQGVSTIYGGFILQGSFRKKRERLKNNYTVFVNFRTRTNIQRVTRNPDINITGGHNK